MTIYLPILLLMAFCSFQILTLRNNATMNIVVPVVYVCTYFYTLLNSLGYIPRSGIAGTYDICPISWCSTLVDTAKQFSKMVY